MHIIGFSHHYTKIHGQTYGILLSVTSTKPMGYRPDDEGIMYDTQYKNPLHEKWLNGELRLGTIEGHEEFLYYPLKKEDFDKPLLQLVFIGEKQIPFTTYRKFPKNYLPLNPGCRTYRKTIPYSDLVGQCFAFKFKGEVLPSGLLRDILTRTGNTVNIFD